MITVRDARDDRREELWVNDHRHGIVVSCRHNDTGPIGTLHIDRGSALGLVTEMFKT